MFVRLAMAEALLQTKAVLALAIMSVAVSSIDEGNRITRKQPTNR
jgi:hypothetical protein